MASAILHLHLLSVMKDSLFSQSEWREYVVGVVQISFVNVQKFFYDLITANVVCLVFCTQDSLLPKM